MLSKREPNQRQSLRLQDYDYSQAGLYFVTLCTHQRQTLFGAVAEGMMQETPAGLMAKGTWAALPARFPFVVLGDFIVMPNHLHGLLWLKTEVPEQEGRTLGLPFQLPQRFPAAEYVHPTGTEDASLGRVVQAFKSLTTHLYTVGVKQNGWPAFNGKIWQRDYHDQIVRDEPALDRIRRYIADNPHRWEQDEENPQGINVFR